MVKVLIVDDSPAVRALLVHVLEADPVLHVVGAAADGGQALRMAASLRPDVIAMGPQMPDMDGLEATRRIMHACPAPIVIVSDSENASDAGVGMRAIEAGALVTVRRPFGVGHPLHEHSAQALVRTVKSMAEVRVVRRWAGPGVPVRGRARPVRPRRLVLLGASTGGPAVLREILAELPRGFALPLVIVQHMAPGFSVGLAEWLSAASGFPVALAADGERLLGGRAWLAPDGFQLGVTRDLTVTLSQAAPEHGMRPSVSHLFRSVHADLRPDTVAALLTGMGKDGAQELCQLRHDGATTIAQDRASAAVYGMPGEAVRLDGAMLVLGPADIGKLLCAIHNDPGADLSLPAIFTK